MIGFEPVSYTVVEGLDDVVTLTAFRTSVADIPASINFTTIAGTANGTHHIHTHLL